MPHTSRPLGLLLALLLPVALATGSANAQPATVQPAPGGANGVVRPWAKGVSAADQSKALQLFREGNQFLRDSLFVKASAKYREAVAHWEHPAIYFNLALALLNLDQPIEVYQSLEKAMKYGVAPLAKDKFAHARSYKRVVGKLLSRLKVECNEPGAKVSLDGKALFTAPGKFEGLVRFGEHSIVAQKAGFVTTNINKLLKPGETTTIEVKLYTAEALTRYQRKWQVWKPWAVVGGGGATLALGALLHLRARSNFRSYDAGIEDCGGCVPDSSLSGKKDSAKLQQNLAFVSYVVGAAALASGVSLLYVNRNRPYRIDTQAKRSSLTVLPVVGKTSAGVSAAFTF